MMFKEINYKEICNFYWNIYHKINKIVSDTRWGEDVTHPIPDEVIDKYEKETLNIDGWLERGAWRLGDLEDLLEYSDDKYFFYYAMNNLSNMRHRLEKYFEDTSWEYPTSLLEEYKKYDDIVMDYYQPIRLNQGEYHKLREEQSYWLDYYHNLLYRKSGYKWIKHDLSVLYRETGWLRQFVYGADKDRDYTYSVSKIHGSIQDLLYEIYILQSEVEKRDLDDED